MDSKHQILKGSTVEHAGVEAITQLALAAYDLPGTDIPAQVIPEGATLQSLEHLEHTPFRMRAVYSTERIADFCSYIEAEGNEHTVVFVEPKGTGAMAVIDYGTNDEPDWGAHKANLSMQPTPEFDALKTAAKKKHGQRELIEFIEDWRDYIERYVMNEDDPDEAHTPLAVGAAIARIRKADVKKMLETGHEERDWGGRRSSLASIEVSSGGEKPPAGFKFRCLPYPGCGQRTIDVRLSVNTTQDAPIMLMRIVAETALDREIAEEIELDITGRLNGKRVFIGSARTNQPTG